MGHTYRDLVFSFSPPKDKVKLKQLLGQNSKELFGKELTESKQERLARYIIEMFITKYKWIKVRFEMHKCSWLNTVFQPDDFQQPSTAKPVPSTPKLARKRPFGDITNK